MNVRIKMGALHHGLHNTEWTDNGTRHVYRIGPPSTQIIEEEAGVRVEGASNLGETTGCRFLGCGVGRFKEQWA